MVTNKPATEAASWKAVRTTSYERPRRAHPKDFRSEADVIHEPNSRMLASSRSKAARVGGVGLQIIRDWVLRFSAEGPERMIDRKAAGPAPRLNAEHRTAGGEPIESSPIPAFRGVVRWRLIDLCQWLWESSVSLSVARQTLSRELRALGRMPEHRPGEPAAASGFCHGLNASSTPIGARRQGRRGGEQLALGIRFSLGRDAAKLVGCKALRARDDFVAERMSLAKSPLKGTSLVNNPPSV